LIAAQLLVQRPVWRRTYAVGVQRADRFIVIAARPNAPWKSCAVGRLTALVGIILVVPHNRQFHQLIQHRACVCVISERESDDHWAVSIARPS